MSTYSTNLALELIDSGDQSGTWGTTTNTNLGTLIEQAISGYVTQAITDGADTTITIPNGASGVARNMVIEMTGSLGISGTLIVPVNKKLYFIYNNTSGDGLPVTVKVSGQTGVSVPNGKKVILASNGTDVVEQFNQVVGTLAVGGTLGVTGATTLSSTVAVTGATTLAGALVGDATTDAISTTSGAFQTDGGMGVAKALWVGGLANIAGVATLGVGAVLNTPASGTLSSCTVDGTNEVGFKNIPINSQSADYTLVLADSGKCIFHPSTDNFGRQFTIPASTSVAYPLGTTITFINLAATASTIAITTDTMHLSPVGTTGSRTLAEYGFATAIKVSGLNQNSIWIISGDGLT